MLAIQMGIAFFYVLVSLTSCTDARPLLTDFVETARQAQSIARPDVHDMQPDSSSVSMLISKMLRSWKTKVLAQPDTTRSLAKQGITPINVYRQEERLVLDPTADLRDDRVSVSKPRKQRLAPLQREQATYDLSLLPSIHE